MATTAKTAGPATPTGKGNLPPVETGGTKKPTAVAPVPSSASTLAVKHGGRRGGRAREDGLVPGSEKALEADKERDAKRKREERADAKALVDPPPIPPAAAPGVAVAGVPGAPVPPVLWEPKMLEPLVKQIVESVEGVTSGQITSRAEKCKLPSPIIVDIKQKAKWNQTAKDVINLAAPRCAAKWMNKTGLSAEYQDEIALAGATATIVAGHVVLLKRLDELIRATNPELKKPAAAAPAAPGEAVSVTHQADPVSISGAHVEIPKGPNA